MAKQLVPNRSLEQARNELVKKIYGGNESKLLKEAQSIIDRLLVKGNSDLDSKAIQGLKRFGVSNIDFIKQ